MEMYLVEYDNLVTSDPIIEIICGKNEDEVWESAFARSGSTGLSQGNFSMYRILRNPGGYLYLADQEGNEIRSGGGVYFV